MAHSRAAPNSGTSWQSYPGSVRKPSAASAPALPFDEDKPSNRCVNLHRDHPRPSLFELDFEKVRPRKWPGFAPPRATALCRRSVAYYCSAAYSAEQGIYRDEQGVRLETVRPVGTLMGVVTAQPPGMGGALQAL